MGKWIRRLLALAMITVLLANAGAAYLAHSYNSPGPLTSEKSLVFQRKQSFRSMVDTLEKEGVIRDAFTVTLIAAALKKAHRFKAGEYRFPAGISAHQVVDMIVDGRVVMRKVTLPEGRTVEDAVALLNREPALTGEITAGIPEGTLLPQTYLFTYGDKRASLIAQMQTGMQKAINELWPHRQAGLPLSTPHEALILASIVEKETGVAEERPRVAAVFINRLRLGMRLQSDPTVVYGLLKRNKAPLGRALQTEDLKIETPYNTYIIAGLPPTPIANPGKDAIRAVLNPPKTKELYFVATGSGGHYFAETLEEHNRNVRMYRAALSNKQQ